MTRVKICGITRLEDALMAAKHGAWAVGFIFYKKSPRYISPFKAKKIIQALPPFVTPVGVFVDQKEGAVMDIVRFCGIRTVQFHGQETPAYCKRFRQKGFSVIKAFRVEGAAIPADVKVYEANAILLDAYVEGVPGGTGKTFNWSVAKKIKGLGVPVILSGGLHYNNVVQAIEDVKPYAVDVSSGVEEQDKPGVKNDRSVRVFCEQALL